MKKILSVLLLTVCTFSAEASFSDIPDYIEASTFLTSPLSLTQLQNSQIGTSIIKEIPSTLFRVKYDNSIFVGSMPTSAYTSLVEACLYLPETSPEINFFTASNRSKYEFYQYNNNPPLETRKRVIKLGLKPVLRSFAHSYFFLGASIKVRINSPLPLNVPNPHLNFLPHDFNPELYIKLNPGLSKEAQENGGGPLEYAKWQFTFYGYKHGLNYLPQDFNPELYIKLNPDLIKESQNKKRDPIRYAKWHYAFFGYKGLNYLPEAFNPEYYNILNPGVAEEAIREGKNPTEYAKWHYAFFGYKGLNYLPEAFNPEYYNILNPGVAEEAIRKEKNPTEYAKWHYAFYGYTFLNYLPEAFNPEYYNVLNPSVAEEAIRKEKNPTEYAKWHYAFYGYIYGLKYLP